MSADVSGGGMVLTEMGVIVIGRAKKALDSSVVRAEEKRSTRRLTLEFVANRHEQKALSSREA